ncbi:transmembrane protein 53 [Elgaria multicarinata webbii]|uniref:transmembrane protein 53 n=1 Tax=Elgaria multicarinata webbii TaxID=159646 RepID=UPI002FCD492E
MGMRSQELPGCVVEFPSSPLERGVDASAEKGDKVNLPVVILLGWAGCKDRYLEKYSATYLQKGCVVIRYTAPWRMVFFSESFGIKSLQKLAKKLLELLFDFKVETKPLFFHVFSNGGVMLYRYIVELLHTQQQFQHLRVVGTVFDSAPGRKNLLGALRALSLVLAPYNICVKYSLLMTFAVVVVTLRIMLYPVTHFVHESHYDAMLKQPSGWPELYLYSRADSIILASDVENMVVARRQQQVFVKAVDFMDSDHVSHMRAYPTLYVTHCTSFMYSCIGST